MAFPTSVLDLTVEVALSADLTALPSTWVWTDATDYVLARDGVVITRGGYDGSVQSPPSTCRLTLDNTDGRWVTTNPTGAWYGQLSKGTPIRIKTGEGSTSVRWTGFLVELPPRWDPSETDRYVPVTAAGILRRLQRGQTPLRSPLLRTITGTTRPPVAYWPGEDGAGATSIAEFYGRRPMQILGQVLTPASDGPDGSSPLPEFTTSAGVTGIVPNHAVTGEWSVMKVFKFPAVPSAETIILVWRSTGTYPVWRILLTPSSPDFLSLQGFDSAKVMQIDEALTFSINGAAEPYDQWLILYAGAVQNGADVDYQFGVFDATGGASAAGTETGITAGVVGDIREVADSKINGMHAGHWAVWDLDPVTLFTNEIDSQTLNGYDGEAVRTRAVRLGNEESVGVETDSIPSIEMGPQSQDTFINLVRECEAVGGGRLYENLDPTVFNAPLRLKFAEDIENQATVLTLNHDSGHLAPEFQPTDDDQNLRNDWTATRTGASGTGSSARVVADSGNLKPSDVGNYDDSVSVNVFTDEDLPHQAGWRVNIGTHEGLRLPIVTLNLARNPGLIADWIGCDITDRITITNPPPGLAPDDIDLIIEGWVETFGPYTWQVQLNCSPYAPWHAFQLAETSGDTDPYLGRLAGDEKAAIRANLTSTATGALNIDANRFRWTTAADDFDPDLRVRLGGEVIEVSAISTSAATFVAAGAASHADNAAVSPAIYAGATTRRLILVLAAIRSSGTGTLATPSGYTRLPVFAAGDNVQLFAKVSDGAESAPTVTPSGGAAGDTVSAVTFGFGNMPCSLADLGDIVVDSVTQLNASAQNIAYGGLFSWEQEGCVQLIVGWKQDDFTSVAVPSGFTEIGEWSTVVGSDQSLYAAYRIDTTPVPVNGASLVVTGGASAISRSAVVALAGGLQIMTVSARSLNGVVKSHAVGTLIEVEDAGVLSL